MSYQAVDGVDYMADEQEMEEFGNEFADENYVRDGDLVLDEYNMVVSLLSLNSYNCLLCFSLYVFPLHWQVLNSYIFECVQLTRVTDTSAAQARQGKDIQGIPWDRLSITRDKYRLTRLEEYRNYENVPSSGDTMDKVCYLS